MKTKAWGKIMMYEKYFLEIVSAIQKKTLIGADIVFAWAAAHQPELYAQERVQDEELNELWSKSEIPNPTSEIDKGGLGAFRAKVLAWGRTVLQIYKKFVDAQRGLQ